MSDLNKGGPGSGPRPGKKGPRSEAELKQILLNRMDKYKDYKVGQTDHPHHKDYEKDKAEAHEAAKELDQHYPRVKKSEEVNMDIEKEIEAMAEKLEKSVKTEREFLMDLVREIGAEGIKKAFPALSLTQQNLLKSVLVEEIQKSMKLDDKIIAAPKLEAKIGETKLQEEVADDNADEKIAQAAESEINHQGGEKQDGWQGQVIKSEETKPEDKNMNLQEFVKSMTDEQKEEVGKKLIAKGMEQAKVEELLGKAMSKEEAKDKIMDMEVKEHKTANPEKLVEAEKKEHQMKKADEVQTPKFSWEDPDRLLKACTGGRNHHFSVNGYYDEVLAKSKEEPKTEELKKSDKESINDILEKAEDCSALDIKHKKMMEDEKKKQNGKIQKSFMDVDMAEALGLSEEECKKILGDV